MKNYLLALGLFLATSPLFAQIGVSGGYTFFNAPEWETAVNEASANQNDFLMEGSVWLGVDYWFRLKNKRVEFLPTLSYQAFEDEIVDLDASEPLRKYTTIGILGFHFNTNIYPFDFNSDCECPTWSKGNDAFKKGFFIQLTPGIAQFRQQYVDNQFTGEVVNGIPVYEQTTTRDNPVHFSLGAAVGLDIGLSDLITVTPVVGFRYSSNVEWEALADDLAPTEVENANITSPYAGLRLGLRFDQ